MCLMPREAEVISSCVMVSAAFQNFLEKKKKERKEQSGVLGSVVSSYVYEQDIYEEAPILKDERQTIGRYSTI